MRQARAWRNDLRRELDRAEAAAAAAFAEAQNRGAEHILDRLDDLHTELAVLTSAGGYEVQRTLTLPPTAGDHLEPLGARGIGALASNGFTLTPVHVGDDRQALTAMEVLHSAAAAQGRKVLWCTTTDARSETIRANEVADSVVATTTTAQKLADGTWELPADSIMVIDEAADVEPRTLAALAAHADRQKATLLLLDSGERHWSPQPSAALMQLLHRDLPWAVTLSVADESAVQQHSALPPAASLGPDRTERTDLAPVLDQADKYDRDLLPPEVIDALEQRNRLRDEHRATHRFHNMVWRAADTAQSRQRDDDLQK